MFRFDFRMAREYLSAKPVARQVLDRESPSVKAREPDAPPADTAAQATSAAPTPLGAAKALPPVPRSATPQNALTGGRPRKSDDLEDEPITRGYVAQILGVNVSTVRRLETRGQLHPKVGPGGIRYFQMHEVRRLSAHRLRLLRSQSTEMKLAAFVLFRKSIDWRDVAIELRYDPHRIYRLWRLYTMNERAGATNDTRD
jgi:hypothetical protein